MTFCFHFRSFFKYFALQQGFQGNSESVLLLSTKAWKNRPGHFFLSHIACYCILCLHFCLLWNKIVFKIKRCPLMKIVAGILPSLCWSFSLAETVPPLVFNQDLEPKKLSNSSQIIKFKMLPFENTIKLGCNEYTLITNDLIAIYYIITEFNCTGVPRYTR
jgi:hypothetical protein